MNSYEDWMVPLEGEIPLSCCMVQNGVIGEFICDSTNAGLFEVGCVDQFGSFIKSHAVSLGAAGIAIAVIQVILFFKYIQVLHY